MRHTLRFGSCVSTPGCLFDKNLLVSTEDVSTFEPCLGIALVCLHASTTCFTPSALDPPCFTPVSHHQFRTIFRTTSPGPAVFHAWFRTTRFAPPALDPPCFTPGFAPPVSHHQPWTRRVSRLVSHHQFRTTSPGPAVFHAWFRTTCFAHARSVSHTLFRTRPLYFAHARSVSHTPFRTRPLCFAHPVSHMPTLFHTICFQPRGSSASIQGQRVSKELCFKGEISPPFLSGFQDFTQ
jgi:hypothetical protein